jgi:hypothetical protein
MASTSRQDQDGSRVVLRSAATNLDPTYTFALSADQVCRYERTTGQVRILSPALRQESGDAVLSADGQVVAFASLGSALDPSVLDGNTDRDVFVVGAATLPLFADGFEGE